MEIRLAGIVNESVVDGPGVRMTIFTQGCPHNCSGCQNPETHDFNGGYLAETADILEPIAMRKYVKGISISGGEPMCQSEATADLVKKAKEMGKDVVIYTGYLFEKLINMAEKDPSINEIIQNADYIIDGPFKETEKSLSLAFRGSSNQRIIDVASSLSAGKVVVSNF